MMIVAMLENLSTRIMETKIRNSEVYIRQQMNLYVRLQKALNLPMLILVSVG